jgi:hypothetical protein
VKENCCSLSLIADPCCQTGPRAATGTFCRFSAGFGLAPMALAGGRGAMARQCAKSGAVRRRARVHRPESRNTLKVLVLRRNTVGSECNPSVNSPRPTFCAEHAAPPLLMSGR